MEIANKRKALQEDPLLASRPMKYMRQGDIKRLKEERERKEKEEKEAREKEEQEQKERELAEQRRESSIAKVSVPVSTLSTRQVKLMCCWRTVYLLSWNY